MQQDVYRRGEVVEVFYRMGMDDGAFAGQSSTLEVAAAHLVLC